MRLNVYTEELSGKQSEILTKISDGVTYTGVRVVLKGEHNAITFWAPGNRLRDLREVFEYGLTAVDRHLEGLAKSEADGQ